MYRSDVTTQLQTPRAPQSTVARIWRHNDNDTRAYPYRARAAAAAGPGLPGARRVARSRPAAARARVGSRQTIQNPSAFPLAFTDS
jgi:hypothetical protein